MVGGRGERLKPLTDFLPKPMVLVNGRPFLEYQLNLLNKSGISRIVLLTGYLSGKISEYFGNGERYNLKIEYSVETESLGTAGAIKNAQRLLDERFLFLNGDTYFKIDYQDFVRQFEDFNNLVGILCISPSKLNNLKGNIEIDQDYFVTNFKESSDLKSLPYVFAGCAIYSKHLLDYIPASKKVSMEDEIFPLLSSKRCIKGYPMEERFYDIGTFRRLTEIGKIFK